PIGMGSSTEHPVPAAHLAISKQRGDARVSDGDGLQQSPQGDDSPQSFQLQKFLI
ncbi:MAG: hypothetical protein EZS28_022233, partial [Streblomastix strix]